MSDAHKCLPLRRVKGGFRQIIDTELGEEQLCRSCGEPWPTDQEFYVVTATSMTYECKACTADGRRGPGVARDVNRELSGHLNGIAQVLRLLAQRHRQDVAANNAVTSLRQGG